MICMGKPSPRKTCEDLLTDELRQWDYGNTFTNPGCPNGNCLRSQINQTETEAALSMLTKAGVRYSEHNGR